MPHFEELFAQFHELPPPSTGPGGPAAWGSITGTLSDQIDLQAALNGKQTQNANLDALAGLVGLANRLAYFTGAGAMALTSFSAGGRALVNAAGTANTVPYFSALNVVTLAAISAGGRALINAAGTVDTFPYFSAANVVTLQAITNSGRALVGVTGAANTVPYFTAANAVALANLSAAGRALVNMAGTAGTFPYFNPLNTVGNAPITTAGLALVAAADSVPFATADKAKLDSLSPGGGGTVTSVGLALPAIFTVTGSPVIGAGTLTGALATQAANLVWAGPASGAAAAPTFRALAALDVPALPQYALLAGAPFTGSISAPLVSIDATATLGTYLRVRKGTGSGGTLPPPYNGIMGDIVLDANASAGMTIVTPPANTGYYMFHDGVTAIPQGGISYSHASATLQLLSGGTVRSNMPVNFTSTLSVTGALTALAALTVGTTLDVTGIANFGMAGAAVFPASQVNIGNHLRIYRAPTFANFAFCTASGTLAAPTQTVADQQTGQVNSFSYLSNNTWAVRGPSVKFFAAEAQTATAQGCYITFSTIANGTITQVDRMRIAHDGHVLIGTAVDDGSGAMLQVTGNAAITGDASVSGALAVVGDASVGGALALAGAMTAASFIPSGAAVPVNGMYLPSANTIGFATNSLHRMRIDVNGNVQIGSTTGTGITLRLSSPITNGTTAYGLYNGGTVQSDVVTTAYYYRSQATTAVAAFTLTSLNHFAAGQGTLGAGSAISNQYGFVAQSSLIGATNNIGFAGQIPAGTNRWNAYMSGTAQNWFAGNVGIGAGNSVPTVALDVVGDAAISGAVNIGGAITGASSARFNGATYGSLGVRKFASGVLSVNTSRDAFVIEADAATGMSILSPNNVSVGIAFGDPENNVVGQVRYHHATDVMDFCTAGQTAIPALQISATGLVSPLALSIADTTLRAYVTGTSAVTATMQQNGLNNAGSAFAMGRYNVVPSGPIIITATSSGATVGSHGVAQLPVNTLLGRWSFNASDTAAFVESARIDCLVEAGGVVGSVPGALRFSTTAIGGASGTTALTLAADKTATFTGAIVGALTGRFNGATLGTLGVRAGASAATPNAQRSDFVIEASGAGGMSFLTPNTAIVGIAFGDPQSSVAGQIRYDHSTDVLDFITGTTGRGQFSAAGLGVAGDVTLSAAGNTLKVKEGANASMGIATLVAGVVVVSTTKVTANSRIYLTCQTSAGTRGSPGVTARTAGTSFTITSTSLTDTSTVAWLIVEPAP